MIAVEDLIYVKYRAPDLDKMEKFLVHFGLHRALRNDSALYMHGQSDAPYLHVTELATDSAAIGFGMGMRAASLDDLKQLASETGNPVEENPMPGGGFRVLLVDPGGFEVSVHHGLKSREISPSRSPHLINDFNNRARQGKSIRTVPGPSTVLRLGHIVLQNPDIEASYRFYSSLLGMKVSDAYFAGTPDNVTGRFLRCGLGERFTDHHTIGLFRNAKTRMGHSAFQVLDVDDLMVGQVELLKHGYEHSWGMGRHIEGSQIFDYWRDPFGNKIEHWTDGDIVNDSYSSSLLPMTPNGLAQWAPPIPASFFD